MFPLLVKLLSFANINNSFFVNHHNSLNLSYKVEENQFKNRNYTDEFYITDNNFIPITNNQVNLYKETEEYKLPINYDWRRKRS